MKTEIKYAVIFVILSFVWNNVEFVSGLHSTHINLHPFFVTPFFIILTALIYILALREKRRELGGIITFGKAFVTGIIITLVIIILNPVFQYIFSEYINPNFYNAFVQNEVVTGKLTRNEAEDYYNFKNFLLRGSVYRLIMGIIASLTISIFIKKNVVN